MLHLRPLYSLFTIALPEQKLTALDRGCSVDLFVRESNDLAIGLYESLGYMVYRRVQAYYGGGPKGKDEDGFGESACFHFSLEVSERESAESAHATRVECFSDMRKPQSRDRNKISIQLPNGATDGRNVVVQPEDVWF